MTSSPRPGWPRRRVHVRGLQALPRLSRTRAARRARLASGPLRRPLREPHPFSPLGHRRHPSGGTGLGSCVRLSGFDTVPSASTPTAWASRIRGVQRSLATAHRWAFGLRWIGVLDATRSRTRPAAADAARELGVRWICVTAGSPYYNPHIQRPALVSTARRLPAAGGSTARRRATYRGHRAAQSAPSPT